MIHNMELHEPKVELEEQQMPVANINGRYGARSRYGNGAMNRGTLLLDHAANIWLCVRLPYDQDATLRTVAADIHDIHSCHHAFDAPRPVFCIPTTCVYCFALSQALVKSIANTQWLCHALLKPIGLWYLAMYQNLCQTSRSYLSSKRSSLLLHFIR